MTLELFLLGPSVVLLLVHVSVQALTYKSQVGNALTVGARDAMPPAGKRAGRADRALRNFLETYPGFVAVSLAVVVAEVSSVWTQAGAVLYLGFRVLYLPLYLAGVPWVRSICWNLATLGLAIMATSLIVALMRA